MRKRSVTCTMAEKKKYLILRSQKLKNGKFFTRNILQHKYWHFVEMFVGLDQPCESQFLRWNIIFKWITTFSVTSWVTDEFCRAFSVTSWDKGQILRSFSVTCWDTGQILRSFSVTRWDPGAICRVFSVTRWDTGEICCLIWNINFKMFQRCMPFSCRISQLLSPFSLSRKNIDKTTMFFRDKLRHWRNLLLFFRDKLRHGRNLRIVSTFCSLSNS